MGSEANLLSGSLAGGPERLIVQPSRPSSGSLAKILRARNEDIHIGENSSFEGSFETEGAIFVDGALTKAKIQASQLSVGPNGKLEGEVAVSSAEIAGAFAGRMVVTSALVLRSTAKVEGEIECAELVTHRGASVRAQVASRSGNPADASTAVLTRASFGSFWRQSWRRSAPLGGAFLLGSLAAFGALGTFLLFRMGPMIAP